MSSPHETNTNGPSTDTQLTRIILKGDSYQRGLQYGRAFKDYLPRFYDYFVGRTPADVLTTEYRGILEELEQTTNSHFPQLLQEIKGWSDGARLPHDMCRILAFHNEVRYVVRPGCANVAVTRGPDGPWLARNCDLFLTDRSWQVMKVSMCDDTHCHAGLGYLGLPGIAGVNRAGLAVGGASMPAGPPETHTGLPNMQYYLIATQDTVEHCCQQASDIGHIGKGVNLTLVDSTGSAVVLEMGAGQLHIRQPDHSGLLVATNHSASGEITPPDRPGIKEYLDSSHSRYDRLHDIVGGARPQDRTIELARRALADHHGRWTVCEHVPDGFNTIHSTVVIPRKHKSEIHLCWGYPCKGTFEIIRPFEDHTN